MNYRYFTAGLAAAMLLTGCAKAQDASTASTASEGEKVTLGAVVTADEASPSGYTVNFAYDGSKAEKTIESVSVTGPFQYVDPAKDLTAEGNQYTPDEYENGFYATNFAPAGGMANGWGYTEEMKDEDGDGIYEASFPITSGSFAYSYVIKYEGEEEAETIADHANPSPAAKNPNSLTQTGDITHSIVYGHYDETKQSKSLNLDYVNPTEGKAGKQEYVSYKGLNDEEMYLGVYTPADYDADREEPYKVIYMSHGGGGNETDWFAMGHVDNIEDNLVNEGKAEEAIIVTMDNAHYEWDYAKIEENVLDYVIPFVEENYNVSEEVKDRAFCGLSMGGMTTMNMYFDHPTEFGYFGIFSGTDMTAVKDTKGLDEPKVLALVGTCDIASGKIMPNDDETKKKKYEDLEELVNEKGMDNVTCGGYVYGAHDWFTWAQCFEKFSTETLWK